MTRLSIRIGLATAIVFELISGLRRVEASQIALPCQFTDLLQPGAFVQTGGMQFSDFVVTQDSGGQFETQVTVSDGTSGNLSGLSFIPLGGAFGAAGVSPLNVLEFDYKASPINPNATIAASQIAIDGDVRGDSFVESHLSLVTAGSSLLSTPLGTIDSFRDTVFGDQLSANLSLPQGISAISAQMRCDAQSFDAAGAATLVVTSNQFVVAVPEPSAGILGTLGLLGFVGLAYRPGRETANQS